MRNTIVLVRTDNFQKASVALADLVRYGGGWRSAATRG